MDKEREEKIKELSRDIGIAFQLSQTTRFTEIADQLITMGWHKSSDKEKETTEVKGGRL